MIVLFAYATSALAFSTLLCAISTAMFLRKNYFLEGGFGRCFDIFFDLQHVIPAAEILPICIILTQFHKIGLHFIQIQSC